MLRFRRSLVLHLAKVFIVNNFESLSGMFDGEAHVTLADFDAPENQVAGSATLTALARVEWLTRSR